MAKVRASAVIFISVAVVMAATGWLAYPLGVGVWNDLQKQRAQEREFVIASDYDQRKIVRSLLIKEMQKPPLCAPSGICPEEPIYLDRFAAVLRSADDPEPWRKYETRSLGRDGALVNRGDVSVPLPLQELLDRVTQVQTYNADPMLPGLTYVSDAESLPSLGEPDSCSESMSPRLVRVSSAAVQKSAGAAIVLVARRWCDGSGSHRVTRLKREGSDWRVMEDY